MSNSEQFIIPSSPEDRKKLRGVIEEIARCLQRTDDERSSIKDILEHAKEELGIPPKYTRKLARTYYKNSFNETQSEYEDFEALYTTVMEENTTTARPE